jgi:hypothetical protein
MNQKEKEMKITIIHEDRIVTVEDGNVVDIYDCLYLIKDAIPSLGFHVSTVNDGFISLGEELREERDEDEK